MQLVSIYNQLSNCYNKSIEKYRKKWGMEMEIDQNKIELLKWLAQTIGETAIAKMIEAGVDRVKLFGKAETEAELTSAQKYNAYVVGKFCKKEESSLVSEEALSQESVYIDAYIKHGENEPEEKILDRIDQWSQKDKSGVMLIHGEPGHGKTTLCRKAVYEFYRNRFGEKKTNVFWFRLNPAYSDIIQDGELVLENAFCWGNIKSQREMIPLRENKEAYEKSIIFLDGYDELKVQAQSINIRLRDFIDTVEAYAEEYQIHFVVTARTRSVEDELYELEIPILQFAPMTEKQQDAWIHARTKLQSYEPAFEKLRNSSKEMKEMLGIPILFRMVVEAELEDTASGVVALYDKLFRATMERRKMKSGNREDWHKEYEQLAYEIYCNDETFANMRGKELPKDFLYLFYLKGNGEKRVEFLHRSFYQYFLAHFLYQKMSEVEDEESAEAFLCCLAERRIDRDVLNYIQQIQEKKPDITKKECECILDEIERTDAIIADALRAKNKNGNAEKHRLQRCNNIFVNALSICCIVAGNRLKFLLQEKYAVHRLIRSYDSENVWLEGVDLSEANLDNANLCGVYLNYAILNGASLASVHLEMSYLNDVDLVDANLNYADLSSVHLKRTTLAGTDLYGANLCGADLREANLERADLIGANLSGADLTGANLNDPNLRWTKNLDKCNCAQVAAWTGCEISLRDRDNLGLDDPDAYGIIWCDNYGIPIKS